MSTFHRSFVSLEKGYQCVIEDDGRVAYAYLMVDNVIVSDLWLYNQAPTPDAAPWSDPSQLPFLNPKEYVEMSSMSVPIRENDDVHVEWVPSEVALQIEVHIYLRGQLYGRLVSGIKPGWTVAAFRNGPLAQRLE